MAVRLLVLRAGRPLHPGRFLVLISVGGRVDHSAAGSIRHLKNTASGLETAISGLEHNATFFYYLISEAIGTAATPGLLC
jgi:hypothetical protein